MFSKLIKFHKNKNSKRSWKILKFYARTENSEFYGSTICYGKTLETKVMGF